MKRRRTTEVQTHSSVHTVENESGEGSSRDQGGNAVAGFPVKEEEVAEVCGGDEGEFEPHFETEFQPDADEGAACEDGGPNDEVADTLGTGMQKEGSDDFHAGEGGGGSSGSSIEEKRCLQGEGDGRKND